MSWVSLLVKILSLVSPLVRDLPGIPRLVKGVELDVESLVFADDLLRVFVCVEGVHEHQRHRGVVRLVQMLHGPFLFALFVL